MRRTPTGHEDHAAAAPRGGAGLVRGRSLRPPLFPLPRGRAVARASVVVGVLRAAVLCAAVLRGWRRSRLLPGWGFFVALRGSEGAVSAIPALRALRAALVRPLLLRSLLLGALVFPAGGPFAGGPKGCGRWWTVERARRCADVERRQRERRGRGGEGQLGLGGRFGAELVLAERVGVGAAEDPVAGPGDRVPPRAPSRPGPPQGPVAASGGCTVRPAGAAMAAEPAAD